MFTVIVATPRTGSTSLWISLKSEWWPDHHPLPANFNEYYNSANKPKDVYYNKQQLHQDLLEHSASNPDKNIVIKVMPKQLTSQMMTELMDHTDSILHTVRRSYTDQLKSFVVAGVSNSWGSQRPGSVKLLTQKVVDYAHAELIKELKDHSKIFHRHGGELVILEDRYNAEEKYPETQIQGYVKWPCFDTISLFEK